MIYEMNFHFLVLSSASFIYYLFAKYVYVQYLTSLPIAKVNYIIPVPIAIVNYIITYIRKI